MSNEIKLGLVVIAIAFLVEGLIDYVEQNYQPTAQLVREHASALVDRDHDGIISLREWKNVYDRVGVPFNEAQPEPLTTYHYRLFVRFFYGK